MGDLLLPMSRMLAQLCFEVGKKVQLTSQGDEIELSEALAQRLIAPIAHLLRNCVAHGIESPQARQFAGKAELGQLTVTSMTNGSNLTISITDDGAGMNRKQLLKSAQKQGLLVDHDLSDNEVWQLALIPGLSTATKPSMLSGRGVGLDSVKTTVAQLRGDFRIQSQAGLGTTMTIIVPIDITVSD
jgi:two-component system chemotaxis sensor kinase CheA